jgi:hypothetical protein
MSALFSVRGQCRYATMLNSERQKKVRLGSTF